MRKTTITKKPTTRRAAYGDGVSGSASAHSGQPHGTPGRFPRAHAADRGVPAVAVERIRVEGDRISFDVRVSRGCPHRTTPDMAARALHQRPNLARHACVNAVGRTFGQVVEDTPLPHLLEHVAIDMLVESSETGAATFVGSSAWADEPAGLACVQLSMCDDLQTLSAFNQAVAFVNEIVRG